MILRQAKQPIAVLLDSDQSLSETQILHPVFQGRSHSHIPGFDFLCVGVESEHIVLKEGSVVIAAPARGVPTENSTVF